MGVSSELNLEQTCQHETPETSSTEDAARKAHEAAEAKRKAEWEARQRCKKAALQERLDRLAAMSDGEAIAASMRQVRDETERITRRSMKECVAEHVQTLCLDDPAFARQIMHPGKTMVRCFRYINRKAREFLQQEIKDNDIRPEGGVYGGDVPDDLCYQWAADYFNDSDAEEDQEAEEKFVPKPFPGTSAGKRKTKKQTEKKAAKPSEHDGQVSMLEAAS